MFSRKKNFLIILMLGALTTISPFSIDMYLPAFQKIADHFSTSTSNVALSLSSYFIGLAVGQIFYGPFLDRFGRKKPLYFGLTLYIIASILCVFATSIELLITARVFQAVGGCAASVASLAMVRDFFPPADGAKVFSRLMLILSVSPLFAPTVGGWISSTWGWQAIFWTLAVIVSIFLTIVFFFLPEGHKADPSISLNIKSIFRTFLSILKHRQFFTYCLSGAFSFAGLFTYLAGSPAIFLETFHMSEKMFGAVFAFLAVGMIGGGQVNVQLTKKFSPAQIFKVALHAQAVIALIYAVGCILHWYPLEAHIAILFFYISCVGLVYPNAAALSLEPFQHNAGSASALLGTLQMGVGALAGTVFGILKFEPAISVSCVFVLSSLIGVSIYRRI